ncbi:hypothetical protein [Natronobacterium gregoryi]|uniref:Uncharacterized protein n=2 Tax=Natronobacterium gregoryi TaxID=44930 RepID=L0ANQ7_NATGS|nr:hypothetical protein [Natronobacterium gregoryi]AFZ74852.1 hypothetical protein Natgr_3749 [Natronobacterium gregoryi SP2]ELY64599.1 hypothetical protein C490_14560 [Natronobacterium gregoryi SP2]PLK18158.1 hypothetical protein CYV19_18610 [Natronobacterium gregoryi SP2]SFJ66593.1 hypothetical protein SAMN05443661_15416 [Natronobacterium gregoryi]
MKRVLTLAMMVAVVGGLTFMGLAGTAAAHDYKDAPPAEEELVADVPQIEQTADATVDQSQSGEQVNIANVGVAGDGGDGGLALMEENNNGDNGNTVDASGGDGGDVNADNATVTVDQQNTATQEANVAAFNLIG